MLVPFALSILVTPPIAPLLNVTPPMVDVLAPLITPPVVIVLLIFVNYVPFYVAVPIEIVPFSPSSS